MDKQSSFYAVMEEN